MPFLHPASYFLSLLPGDDDEETGGTLALAAVEETIYEVRRPAVDVPEACADYTPL